MVIPVNLLLKRALSEQKQIMHLGITHSIKFLSLKNHSKIYKNLKNGFIISYNFKNILKKITMNI